MSEGQWNEGQWKRWDVVSRLRAGKLTMAQAALQVTLPKGPAGG